MKGVVKLEVLNNAWVILQDHTLKIWEKGRAPITILPVFAREHIVDFSVTTGRIIALNSEGEILSWAIR